MKLENYLFIILIAGIVAYYNFFPRIEIETNTIYTKGDTVTVIINQKQFDSLKYFYEAKMQKMKANEFFNSKVVDTLKITDTLYNNDFSVYSSYFNLGNKSLGTSGIVRFALEPKIFAFDSLEYHYPEVVKTVVDTIKTTNNIYKKGFSHGVQAGFGYGLINGKFDVFIGYGIQFRF